MRDPHIEALYYQLVTGEQLAFNSPPPMECEAGAFSLCLDDGQLKVRMKDHYATDTAARLAVGPYLRSWEIDTALKDDPGAVTFVFERADVVDRDPPSPGASVTIQLLEAEAMPLADFIAVKRTRAKYPDPPDSFVASPNVVAMWEHYKEYHAGRERLSDMAYHCLTVIETACGGNRQDTARRYAISRNVLDVLSHFASEVGDERTARKRVPGQTLRPHTPAEIAWVGDVVKAIIRRVGEWAANPNAARPQITLKDFPSIEDPRRKPKRTHRSRASGAGRMIPNKPNI